MLKGISPLVSPDLLKALCEMGHGDEIILSDAHFPAHTLGVPVLRADGIPVADLLAGILPLLELDAYVDHPVVMMAPVPGDSLDDALMAKSTRLSRRKKLNTSNASHSTNAHAKFSLSSSPGKRRSMATSSSKKE